MNSSRECFKFPWRKKKKKEFESYLFYWGSMMEMFPSFLRWRFKHPLLYREVKKLFPSFWKLSFLFVASLDGPRHKMYRMVREGEINKNHDRTTGSCFGGAIQPAKYSLGFFFAFLHSSIFDIGGFINGITSEGMLMPIFLLNRLCNKICQRAQVSFLTEFKYTYLLKLGKKNH